MREEICHNCLKTVSTFWVNFVGCFVVLWFPLCFLFDGLPSSPEGEPFLFLSVTIDIRGMGFVLVSFGCSKRGDAKDLEKPDFAVDWESCSIIWWSLQEGALGVGGGIASSRFLALTKVSLKVFSVNLITSVLTEESSSLNLFSGSGWAKFLLKESEFVVHKFYGFEIRLGKCLVAELSCFQGFDKFSR